MGEKGGRDFHFNVNVRTNTGSIARLATNEGPFLRAMEIQERKREKIEEGDTLIAFSGSGETAEVLIVAERAKDANAKVVAITSFEDSSLAKMADLVITIPGGLEKRKGWKYLEAQFVGEFYGGGEFELLAYAFQEVLISAIGEYFGIPKDVVIKEHERDSIRRKPSL
jgi:6-phospho-3-hexuloisomerase